MYDYVSGRLAARRGGSIVIDVGGVGYLITTPASTASILPDIGSQVKLLTYFHVTEKNQQLFGFATDAERDIFVSLIGISGVGPKLALAVLSKISADEFSEILSSDDATLLKSVPGVGQKTALRIIVDLRSKLPQLSKSAAEPAVAEDVLLALQSLGYSQYDVKKVIEKLSSRIGADKLRELSTEEVIAEALQV
jgi:Holliday junction DNA helicase RuvA